MLTDCIQVCKDALPCQVKHAKFPSPLYLLLTRKDLFPFHTWCVDLNTNLVFDVEDKAVGKILIVAICTFSKWVEAAILPNKKASIIARWFNCQVTCKFGNPVCIRLD